MKPEVSEMDENANCKFKVYKKRSKRAPVFITDFSHGEVKTNKNELKFESYKKDSDANNVGCDAVRNLIATNGRLTYTGSSSQSCLKYFVGVRKKTTGKMKLFDCVQFRMKPDLKKMTSNIQPTASKSYWEGVNDLTQNFGSKARKRALNTLQKCTVDVSFDETLTIDDSVLHSPDKPVGDVAQHSIDYLPPQNRNASIPSDVFDLNDIISLEESAALNEAAQELLVASSSEFAKKQSSFCKYVSARCGNVSAMKAKLLLYYNYLISFQQLKYADLRRKDPAPGIPDPFKKKMLDKFTLMSENDKGRKMRSCPSQMKDKLVAYILVLALLIDEFKVNLEELQNDLSNVGTPKLVTIAQALGCYVSTRKAGTESAKCAELKIPLNDFTPRVYKKSSIKRF